MPAVARHCQPVPVTPVLTVTNPCNNCHAPKPANPAGAGAGGVLEKSALLQIVGGDKLIIPFC